MRIFSRRLFLWTVSDSASDSVPSVFRLMGTGPGGGLGRGGSLYNVLHWQATGVLLAKAYESVGKSVISLCLKAQKDYQ